MEIKHPSISIMISEKVLTFKFPFPPLGTPFFFFLSNDFYVFITCISKSTVCSNNYFQTIKIFLSQKLKGRLGSTTHKKIRKSLKKEVCKWIKG